MTDIDVRVLRERAHECWLKAGATTPCYDPSYLYARGKLAQAGMVLCGKVNFSEAVWYDDSNEAFRIIQDQMGVDDGGIAAIFFDGWVSGEDEHLWWKQASLTERKDCLVAYVDFEVMMAEMDTSH